MPAEPEDNSSDSAGGSSSSEDLSSADEEEEDLEEEEDASAPTPGLDEENAVSKEPAQEGEEPPNTSTASDLQRNLPHHLDRGHSKTLVRSRANIHQLSTPDDGNGTDNVKPTKDNVQVLFRCVGSNIRLDTGVKPVLKQANPQQNRTNKYMLPPLAPTRTFVNSKYHKKIF